MLEHWKDSSKLCAIGLVILTLPVVAYACTWGNYDDCPSWPSCSKSCGGGSRCRTCESCFWKIDKTFCETCNAFCYNGGVYESGSCQCQSWRSGDCCEQCRQIYIAKCLHGRQECGGSPDGVRCTQCENGYTSGGYGKGCIDVDECRDGTTGCSHGCENTAGSYRCTCPNGYVLNSDGRTCRDIDECVLGGCSQVCTNHGGSFSCSCYPGYQLQADQRSCTDINECRIGASKCSHMCINTAGSYHCRCNQGYVLEANGLACTDIDECADVLNGGCDDLCINTVGSFKCACNGNSTIETDGFTCSGANVEPSNFFSTNGLIHQLLPKGCHYIIMSKCDADSKSIILSSTSAWHKLQSNNDVVYTFGITFVEIKTIVLPL
ncbi:hypothetical protein DPMN_163221 [Dreissena polymorpha]|uniref:EGF-like domain-containing protein n=1 Tax=Dreissena polymorpha TaxID=45954 RepID=A0A9D4IR55_DREPO|nr:hypothetical protein DPMN_163221 [Dreissena polymorpha]